MNSKYSQLLSNYAHHMLFDLGEMESLGEFNSQCKENSALIRLLGKISESKD